MDDYKDALKGRGDMYRLLGRLYLKEVDGDLLKLLKGTEFPEGSDNPKLADGSAKLREALAGISGDEASMDELAADYAKAFLGAGQVTGEPVAFPIESVYTSGARLVAQDSYEDVYRIFRSEGLAKQDRDLFEDHLALEFAYMARLCGRALEALEKGDEAAAEALVDEQAAFLKKHILNWAPAFCEDVRKCPIGPFYKAVSLVTQGWLELEQAAM